MNEERITSDPLFLGLAKPQTLLGAPYGFTVFVLMFSGVMFLLFKNPFVLLIGIPLMLIGRLLVRFDPYALQALSQYFILRTRLRRGAAIWSYPGRLILSVSPWPYYHQQKKRANK